MNCTPHAPPLDAAEAQPSLRRFMRLSLLLGALTSVGLSGEARAEPCDVSVSSLGDPTLRCELFEPSAQLSGMSATSVNVPARFNFQARLSQAKLPLGDRTLPRVVVRVYNLQEQLLCATERSNVEVQQSVLNLELREEDFGGCKLAELMAGYPELKIKVCLGENNCLRPIKLSSVPYALKSEFTYWARSAHRAERASVSHYTHQLSADRDLLNTIKRNLPSNLTGHISADHSQLASLSSVAGLPELSIPATHTSYAGALLWSPAQAQSATLHISSKDPQRDTLRPLKRVAWVADRSVIAGDLSIEGLTVGERRDGLQAQKGDLYLRNPLNVTQGLLVKGEALSQEHPVPVNADTQEVDETSLSPLSLDPTFALSVGDVHSATLNEVGVPLRVTGASTVAGRLSVGRSLSVTTPVTVVGASALYGRLSTPSLTVHGRGVSGGDGTQLTPALSASFTPPSGEQRPALTMASLTTTARDALSGSVAPSSLRLSSGDLSVRGQEGLSVEGNTQLASGLTLGELGDGGASGFALQSLLISYQREASQTVQALSHTSALFSADLLSLNIGDANTKLVVRGETRVRGNVTFTQPPVLLGGCHIRIPSDQEGLPIDNVERFSLVCGEQSVTLRPFRCGNRRIDPGEQCDTGDLADGDGCSSHCLCEPENLIDGVYFRPDAPGGEGDTLNACSGSLCGNGEVDIGEQCDDANPVPVCENCRLPACGNGIKSVDSNGVEEGCDDGNLVDGDGCSSLCQLERNAATVAEDTTYSFSAPQAPLFASVPLDHLVRCDAPQNGVLAPLVRQNNPDGVSYLSTTNYTPTQDFNGNDDFRCQIITPTGSTRSSATFLMTVTPVNDAPTALATLSLTTNEDTATPTTSISAIDVDGDALTVTCTAPVHGSVSVTDNRLTYTPNLNFNGADSFTCTTDDGVDPPEDSVTTNVSVTITPVNDAPTALATLSLTTNEDTATPATSVNPSDVDGDALTVTCTAPTKGTVTVNASNEITYTPTLNLNGADSFNCTTSDGNGGSALTAVSVTITSVNDAPTALATLSLTTNEDTATPATSVNPSDVDGDALTVTCGAATKGTVTVNASNEVTYTPNTNQNGADSFTCTTDDGVNPTTDSATTSVSVTITPVNDAPTTTDDTATTTTGTAATLNVLDNDSDVEGDSLRLQSCTAQTALPVDASFSANTTAGANSGDVSLTTTTSGTYLFDCVVSDGTDTSPSLLTITVN